MSSDDVLRAKAAKLYGPVPNEKFPIPAADLSKVDPKYFRQTVRYDSKEVPVTIMSRVRNAGKPATTSRLAIP